MDNTTYSNAILALSAALRRMRDSNQGGYHDCKDGSFSGSSLRTSFTIQVSGKELDALFALVGIVPDAIVPKGRCKDCVFVMANGSDRGWASPCSGCSRPIMDKFVPVSSLTKKSLKITADEYAVLDNIAHGQHPREGFSDRDLARDCVERMRKRDFFTGTSYEHLTQRGALAMKAFKEAVKRQKEASSCP